MSFLNKLKSKKLSFGFFNNMIFLQKHMWESNRWSSLSFYIEAIFAVVNSLLTLYLSKSVVAAVTDGVTPQRLVFIIFGISFLIFFATAASSLFKAQMEKNVLVNDMAIEVKLIKKALGLEYEIMESPVGQARLSKAMGNTGQDSSISRTYGYAFSDTVKNALGMISYAVLLFSLSPWLLLTVVLTTALGFSLIKLSSKWEYKNKDKWKPADRKLDYLESKSCDFSDAKDIRLYGMADWLKNLFSIALSERKFWHKKQALYNFSVDIRECLVSILREGLSYIFLIWLVYQKSLSVADFVLYFGLINGFTGWLNGFAQSIEKLYKAHVGTCEIREFLELKNKGNYGDGVKAPTDTLEIEFSHVSYRYPSATKSTIEDLSFVVKKGEKLAIVGLNGAGKTTLVKLLCGLYTPTSGEILINGNPINSYNRTEFYGLFSTVFQDIFILPVSIEQNIVADTTLPDKKRVEECLVAADLWDYVSKLPSGVKTKLVKSVSDNAIELSGGQLQKLALARALYKQGQVLVLDEPTAALDPIAESRIYEEYNNMAKGKTSVFISHRLASTRFCDRIFLFENGKIIECGTHEQLMEQKNKYYELFEIQSHYYKKEVALNEN